MRDRSHLINLNHDKYIVPRIRSIKKHRSLNNIRRHLNRNLIKQQALGIITVQVNQQHTNMNGAQNNAWFHNNNPINTVLKYSLTADILVNFFCTHFYLFATLK